MEGEYWYKYIKEHSPHLLGKDIIDYIEQIKLDKKELQNKLDFIVTNDWISVDDKLPNDTTSVLVYGKCCDVCSYIKVAELEQGNWMESDTGEDLFFNPTHWLNLPKPPDL